MSYIIAFILFFVFVFLVASVIKFTIKTTVLFVIAFFILSTASVVFLKPSVRKPFDISIIQKVLKINSDGSTSIIKTTTTRELKQK